jgi:hypothetical protein
MISNLTGFHYSQVTMAKAAQASPSFSGKGFEKTQILCEEYPLVSVEREDLSQKHKPDQNWQTQPSLMIQLLSTGDLNLVNSATRAKEPGLGPWTMHLLYPNPENPHGPNKYTSTQNCSLVLKKSELALVKKYHEPLQIWFSHPNIPESNTPKIKVHAQNGPNCYTVSH